MQYNVRALYFIYSMSGLLLLGCTGAKQDQSSNLSDPNIVAQISIEKTPINTESISLDGSSKLGVLARSLDMTLLKKSGAVHDLMAAKERKKSLIFERYPKITPSANISSNKDSAAIGLEVEQTVLDFGAAKSRMENADIDIQEKSIRLWIDRNEIVFEGLNAFLEISRVKSRVEMYKSLEGNLATLDGLFSLRAAGGIADRGERLRLTSAIQEIQRSLIEERAQQYDAEANLRKLVTTGEDIISLDSLLKSRGMCFRSWKLGHIPEVSLAEIELLKAYINERETRSRRFPRVALTGNIGRNTVGTSNSGFNLRLDASNVLGLGRKHLLKAVSADIESARLSLIRIQESVNAKINQRDVEFMGLIQSEKTLLRLIQNKEETLSVYNDQLIAGTITLAEGIGFYQDDTDNRLLLINIQADIIKNCLAVSLNRGSLAPLEFTND